MKNKIFIIILIYSLPLITFAQAEKTKHYLEFIANVKEGKNHFKIASFLKNNKTVDFLKSTDTILKLNIIELAVFPKIGDPIIRASEIKSDKEILLTLEIFIKFKPELDTLILKNAMIGLIKFNNYLYVPYTYNFLLNSLKIKGYNLNEILQSDKVAYNKFENWLNCK